MRVKEKLQHNKQRDCFVGQVGIGQVEQNGDLVLASSLLCFVISGLATTYRIPIAYYIYFTKGLTGPQLHKLLIFVMQKVEACGFRIVRLVTDNHKVNANCMKLLVNDLLTYRIENTCDRSRLLFISFDACHVLKNVRSQFLSRDLGPNGEISASHGKDLYELQKGLSVKPVRYLSRKHVYPSKIEKMSVTKAAQLMSPSVTVALDNLKDTLVRSRLPSCRTFIDGSYLMMSATRRSTYTRIVRMLAISTTSAAIEWPPLQAIKGTCGHARDLVLTAETHESLFGSLRVTRGSRKATGIAASNAMSGYVLDVPLHDELQLLP